MSSEKRQRTVTAFKCLKTGLFDQIRSDHSESGTFFPEEAMALILHALSKNKNSYKTLITAEFNGVQVDLAPNFEMGVSNKTPHFLKMNPLGKGHILCHPIFGMANISVKEESIGALEEELKRVSAENKKLTEMLTEMCENYNTLRSNLS